MIFYFFLSNTYGDVSLHYIQSEEEKTILHACHIESTAGHMGRERFLHRMKGCFDAKDKKRRKLSFEQLRGTKPEGYLIWLNVCLAVNFCSFRLQAILDCGPQLYPGDKKIMFEQ